MPKANCLHLMGLLEASVKRYQTSLKKFARDKHSSLLCPNVSDEEESLIRLSLGRFLFRFSLLPLVDGRRDDVVRLRRHLRLLRRDVSHLLLLLMVLMAEQRKVGVG